SPAGKASASICTRSGHKSNSTHNIANAAIKTALFHMGRRPSKTPEKTKPSSALRPVCALATDGCLDSGTGVTGIAPVDTGRVSDEVALPGTVSGAFSGEAPGSVVGALAADAAAARLA